MCCMAVVYLHIFLFSFLQVYTSLLFSSTICAVWQLYICIFSFCRFIQVCSLAVPYVLFSSCISAYFLIFLFCRFIQVCSSAIINTICTICMYVLYGSCISAYFLIFFFCRFIQVCSLARINIICTICMYVCAVWQLYICIFSYFLFAGLYKSALQQ